MVAPFVLPAIPIITAIGRFAAPYLVKELGKIGANKFVKTYGDEAFTSLNETLANNTSMVNAEAMPMVNPNYKSQQESKPNIAAFAGDLAIPGYIAPDAEAIEREKEKFREMLKPVGSPIEPPEIPIKTGEAVIPDIDPVEEFPAEEKQLPRVPGFGEGGKINIPIITSMKDGKPEFKYPTEEEIKKYINEENEFWKKNIEKANKENPQYNPKNMPQIVEADKHFGAASYIFQDYGDSKLIYMSPDEYLSLTKEYRPEEGKEGLGSKMNVKKLETLLKEGKELANIPTLYIKKPFEDRDVFEVVGQEGNHRAKAFKNLGYDKIPVVIEGYSRDDRVKTKDVFPTKIISYSNYNKDTKRYEQYDSVSTKPTDFYDVLTKEKLFKADDVNTQTEKLITGTKDLDVLPEATETVLEAEKAIKQTKKLKENKKIEDYFDSLEELYDNEWYGSTKNIQNFFSSQDPDDIPYSYEEMFFQEYGQTKPIHELFENEYQGGSGDLGNSDAAKVMAGGGMYRYGEFNAPEYYQEYQEKLVEHTRKKLGDEFIGYRLTRKEEMDKYLNVDRSMTGEEEFYTKARSYSLSRSTAEGFKYLWSDYFTNADGSPRKDLILIETPIEAESLLMRGKSAEKEVVVSGSYLDSDKMNFYDLKGNLLRKAIKGPLAKSKDIGDNNPPSAIEEDTIVSKTKPKEYKGKITETTSLNENLKKAIAELAGTPEDIAKSSKMPQSHKKKIYTQLEEFLNKNYPSKLSAKEGEVEADALFYITNSVYDIYTFKGEGMPQNTLMVQDDIGFPLATAEIERYPKGKINYYPRRKKGNRYVKTEPAIYIETFGSLNTDATSMILDQIEKIAETEEIRYIVAEDLTSEAAAKALEKRGFTPAKKGFFEGDIINEADWRGGKKNVKQKNMVLDLGKKYQTTEKEIQEEFIKEQTDNLLKKK